MNVKCRKAKKGKSKKAKKQENINSSIKVASQEELGRRKSGNLVF